jgi:hypothetical protein
VKPEVNPGDSKVIASNHKVLPAIIDGVPLQRRVNRLRANRHTGAHMRAMRNADFCRGEAGSPCCIPEGCRQNDTLIGQERTPNLCRDLSAYVGNAESAKVQCSVSATKDERAISKAG